MTKDHSSRPRPWKAVLVSLLSVMGQLAVLVLVAVALLWPAIVDPNQLFAAWARSDLIYSHWPAALLIQRSFVQDHRLPFWNPYFGGGQPQAADPLVALFYPPTQLVHFLSLHDYFLVLILGHLVFAGLGTLLLARRTLKLPAFPALVAAVSYMATPRLLGHLGAGHVTIVQTVAWFPWLALTCWATVREPRRWGATLGLCIALTLLAGHPQMAYYGLLMTASLTIWLLIKRWKLEGRRAMFKPVVALVAASIIGVLLAAVHLLPLEELTALSTRQLAVNSGDTYPLLDFLHALFVLPSPLASGPFWEGLVAPGLVVLILALLAVVTRWREVWPLVCAVVLVAGLAMGNSSLFYLVVSHILPDLDRFRGLARIWFIALLLIALLAGMGSDALLHGVPLLPFPRRLSPNMAVAAVGILTLLVLTLSLIVTDSGYAHIGNVRAVTNPSQLERTAAQWAGSGRIYGQQENFLQASAVQLQVRLADGWDPLLIAAYVNYMQHAGGYKQSGYNLHIPYESSSVQPNAVLLGLMNVSVVLSERPMTDPHLIQVGDIDGTRIYRNTADAGPAYLVMPESGDKLPSLANIQLLPARVHVVTLAPEQDTFTFSAKADAYLVIATPAFPGWTANLDGHPMPIQLIAGTLPAIKVGPGTHILSYTYTPSYVHLGILLSVLGLLATLAWLIIGYISELRDVFFCPLYHNLTSDKPAAKTP